MRRFSVIFAMLLVLSGCMAGVAQKSGDGGIAFERMRDGQLVGFHPMLMDFLGTRLIFIGEVHDNPRHHQLQLEVIKGMQRSGAKLAIAVEMFRAESQPLLDRWVSGELDIITFMEAYRDNWTIPWALYDAIFLYARNNGIPLLALNVPKVVIQKVYREGFAALTPEERRLLPSGISCNVDRAFQDFVRQNYVWHSNDLSTFNHFCEAQLLRDRYMAHRLKEYLNRETDRTLVVLAGVGHAIRRGIPDELESIGEVNVKILIPPMGPIASETVSHEDADYLMRD